jgi:hypothetical protein
MEESPDIPVYSDVEAVFKGRKTTDDKIQLLEVLKVQKA